MATKTIQLSWTPVAGSYGTKIEYKKEGDVSWISPTSPTNPTLYPTYTLTLEEGFFYYIKLTTISNQCAGGSVIKKIFVASSGPDTCCPVGYSLSPDSTYCYQEDIQPATASGGSTLEFCHYTRSADYGNYGVVIYKLGKYNVDGTWNISDPSAKPELLSLGPGLGYNASAFNSQTIAVPHVWLNSDFTTAVDSRLNRGGLWLCGNVNYSGTLGFSRQINIPTSKVYYIGLGADNYASLTINGVTVLNQDMVTLSSAAYFNAASTGFRYWHVYPVQLNAGPNIITMAGTNTGSVGIIGFEIYDATELDLLTVTTALQLEPFIIFTTRDINNNSPSDLGNYNCNAYPGYSLIYDPDSDSYSCKQILTTPTISC